MDPGNDYQWVRNSADEELMGNLTMDGSGWQRLNHWSISMSQKRRQPDFMYLLTEGHTTTWDVVLPKILNWCLIKPRATTSSQETQRMEGSVKWHHRDMLSWIQWREALQVKWLPYQEKKKSKREEDKEVGGWGRNRGGTKKQGGTQNKIWIDKSIWTQINNWID